MNTPEISIVTNRKEILHLVGLDLYNSELTEKLKYYNQQYPRITTTDELDTYLQKVVAKAIVDNEYQAPQKGKRARKKTEKELVCQLAEELQLEIMAVKHVYNTQRAKFEFNSSKEDTKDYISSQIYNIIDDLDISIAACPSHEDAQKYIDLKLKALEKLAKIEQLEAKPTNNTTIVQGNVTDKSTNTTNVDKQVVVSEGQAMLGLLKKILPGKE